MSWLTRLLLASALALGVLSAQAQAVDGPGLTAVQRVQVADPYIEFRTGPGRGYPVHYVAERGAWVQIERRHTDWFKLRAETGQVGWVTRDQLLATLGDDGQPTRFAGLQLQDYLQRRVEAGAMIGRFQSEPMVRLWTGWRLHEALALEVAIGQVQGVYSGTSLAQVQLISEPWSNQRWSPFVGVGLGRFNNLPNNSLVDDARTNVNMGLATAGLRVHLAERFVVRLDWTLYTALLGDSGYGEYRALNAGLSFFF
ncbi:hypothetical protein KAK06_22920 [Ideonella sp. 4Y11]|uniref:SH3b domain-containing protein n=1 Tax=Ideonella aquatica TaxID=2824119 RepID=A0A940YTZ2_9BURK|nr:SH3 domain-containing protein [Ideonella aquatica]MBQ0961808.1 hypothetical protein [Ideonella aquatica]